MHFHKSKHSLLILSLSVLAFSCSKEPETSSTTPLVSSTSELNVTNSFDWSASINEPLTVSFINPDNVSLENEFVHLVDANGMVYAKQIVENGAVTFNLTLPQDKDFFVLFPYTGNQFALNKAGSISVTLSEDGVNKKTANKTTTASCTVCASAFENGTMELPVIRTTFNKDQAQVPANSVPGWETTASDNRIEIWNSNFRSVNAQEGNQFFEINATQVSTLYQTLCLEAGSTIKWSVYHRGREGVDVAVVKIGATVATATIKATMTDGKTAWGYYTGTYVVPVGQTNTVFAFEAVSAQGGASAGNFIDNFSITCDADGDGVKDGDDDFPNDITRAYKSYFPTAGRQTVAFEDLWPSVGDYDFNDLVLNNKAEIVKNAANELVEAKFKVSIDAIGAGLENGIAMMLHNANKTALSGSVIASVSGDAALDAGNTNGLILSPNVFNTISQYYQNNGTGPSKTPDTLSFTITFKAGITADFIPELYLFRAADRSLEVHMAGYPLTATINPNYFNIADDAGAFKTANGLPWAIEIVSATKFKQPKERVDILNAYTQFQLWATSLGVNNVDWYTVPDPTKVVGN